MTASSSKLIRTASGLYYLSELVEEHTVLTRRILTRLIYGVIVIQLLLTFVDRFPWKLSALTIGTHVIYLGNLRHFPIIKLTDPIFMLSCGMYCLARSWSGRIQVRGLVLPEKRY